ncbi:hypothetical protein B4168_1299 [Anoxybacillus flavithermus]|nr:hypothetical protein B4168_1299 [Anoxybacillus flavithermus]OAO83668.1 hypothetical protein GT23_4162 [Parageobacillus thermoglucosidasius]
MRKGELFAVLLGDVEIDFPALDKQRMPERHMKKIKKRGESY